MNTTWNVYIYKGMIPYINTMKRKQGLTIYPEKDIINTLKHKAKEDGRSVNNFILRIITKYLKKNYTIQKEVKTQDGNTR